MFQEKKQQRANTCSREIIMESVVFGWLLIYHAREVHGLKLNAEQRRGKTLLRFVILSIEVLQCTRFVICFVKVKRRCGWF